VPPFSEHAGDRRAADRRANLRRSSDMGATIASPPAAAYPQPVLLPQLEHV